MLTSRNCVHREVALLEHKSELINIYGSLQEHREMFLRKIDFKFVFI